MHFTRLVSLAATVSTVAAQYKGFNYGSTLTDGTAKTQADFEAEFAAAKALPGTSGFTSARLYTSIQSGTDSSPILAIPAAIAQDTKLLLGLWASGGDTDYANEITAITSAISTYGTDFTDLVIGISVGSEDLYRTSTIGIAAEAGVGTTPDVLVEYISQLKSALASTALSSAAITHVDTYNAWTNGSNAAVIAAVDFLSMDVYPYFQNTEANSIDNGLSLFNTAYDETVAVADGKDVWVTETGWPVSGSTEGDAVASVANSKIYWDEVGCDTLFGKVNTFWYILQDALPTLPSPSFGLVGAGSVSGTPLFNLTCPSNSSSSSSSSSASVAAAASSTSSSASGNAAVAAVAVSTSSISSASTIGSSTTAKVVVSTTAISNHTAAASSTLATSAAHASAVVSNSTSSTKTTTAAKTAAANATSSVGESTSAADINVLHFATLFTGLVAIIMTL